MPRKSEQTVEMEGTVEQLPVPVITPMDLVARALASGASMEMMEKMLALQERWEANEARKAFEAAMAEAAKEMPIIEKNAQVDFEHKNERGRTSYKYANLADVVAIVGPILGKHGLSHRFETSAAPGAPITVTCRISHKLGHSITNSMTAQHESSGNKNSIQAMGSSITFLSRYTLMAVLGLAAATDDDGTSHREPQAKPDVMERPTQGRKAAPPPSQPAASPSTQGACAPPAEKQAQSSGSPTSQSGAASTAGSPGQPTRMQHVMAVEKAAKEAAALGSAAFDAFWKNTNFEDRKIVSGLGSSLRVTFEEADKLLAQQAAETDAESANEAQEAQEWIDPKTGEVVRR